MQIKVTIILKINISIGLLSRLFAEKIDSNTIITYLLVTIYIVYYAYDEFN